MDVLAQIVIDGEVLNKARNQVPLTSGNDHLECEAGRQSVAVAAGRRTSMAVLPGAADFSVALDTGMPLGIESRTRVLQFARSRCR